jgi:hypothetical protein
MTTPRNTASPREIEEDIENARAEIRRHVLKRARQGHVPRVHPDDIKVAFAGHPDEWAAIAQARRDHREREELRAQAAVDAAHLKAETKRVLKEWDDARYREAEDEARRRLDIAGRQAA